MNVGGASGLAYRRGAPWRRRRGTRSKGWTANNYHPGRRRRLAAAPTSSIIPFQDREMIGMKGPGAVAARGASEMDELSGHAVSKSNGQKPFAQAPILAALVGDNIGEVEGSGDETGFARLERALGEFDALFPGRNNADPLLVLPRRLWARILEGVRP